MRISIFSVNVAVLFLAIFLSFAILSNAEIININDFIQLVPTMIDSVPAFSYDLGTDLYSFSNSSKYAAFVKAKEITNETPGKRTIRSFEPGEINVLSSIGQKLTINDTSTGWQEWIALVAKGDYFMKILKTPEKGSHSALFDMDGKLIQEFPLPEINPSPSAKFFYCTSQGYGLRIYDALALQLFSIPTLGSFNATAMSDSEIAVLDDSAISLWDVKRQTMLWENKTPDNKRTHEFFNGIYSSPDISIIIIKHEPDYYCLDHSGNYLWSVKTAGSIDYPAHSMVGIDALNKTVILVDVPLDQKTADMRFYNYRGVLISEISFEMGSGAIFQNCYGSSIDIFPQMISFRFKASYDGHRHFTTGIAYKDLGSWQTAVIKGPWFLLSDDEGNKALVGFDEKTKKVLGYKANF
jgi:hypothetical protein